MARHARDIVPGMQRSVDVKRFRPTCVAAQALGVNLFRTLCEKEQLGSIRRVCDVLGARAVTRFATLPGRASTRVVRSCPVAGFGPAFVFVCVAVLASIRAGVTGSCLCLGRGVFLSSDRKYPKG